MTSKVIIFGLLALGVAVADAAYETYDQFLERTIKVDFPKVYRKQLNTLCPNVTDEIKDDVTNNMVEKGYQCLNYTAMGFFDFASEFKSKSSAAEATNLFCNKANQYVECEAKFQEIQKPCYNDVDGIRLLNLTYDFACGNNGERVARFITEGGVDCFEKGKTLYQNLSIKLKEITDGTGVINMREYSRITVEKQCDFSDDIFTIVNDGFVNCTSRYPTNVVKEYLKKYKQLIGCPEEPATPPNAPATTMSIPTWLGYTTPKTRSGIGLGENNTL